MHTYGPKKNGHGSEDGENEEERDYLRAALGVWLEDVVDLGLLPVSQRLLVLGGGRIGVKLEFEVEDMIAECLRGAEGAEEERCPEGLGGG